MVLIQPLSLGLEKEEEEEEEVQKEEKRNKPEPITNQDKKELNVVIPRTVLTFLEHVNCHHNI